MNKIFCVFGLLLVFMLVVSAEDCSVYFDDVDDVRGELYEDIKILHITADRMYGACEDLESELDDLDGNDPLTDVSYELETFIQRTDNVLSDMNKMSEHLDDYDDEISDARSDIPSSCYEVYLEYDDDLDDIRRDFTDVKKEWNTFSENIDDIEVFEKDPENYEVSDAKSMVKALTNAIEDFYDEVESMAGPNNTINTGESFTEADCIAMAEVTLQRERAAWNKTCEDSIVVINQTCEECVCDSEGCVGVLEVEKDKLIDCKAINRELQSKYDSLSGSRDSCDSSQVEVDRLTGINDNLDKENTNLRGRLAGLNNTLNTCTSITCEVCGPWFWVALGLFLLMVVGWIFAM